MKKLFLLFGLMFLLTVGFSSRENQSASSTTASPMYQWRWQYDCNRVIDPQTGTTCTGWYECQCNESQCAYSCYLCGDPLSASEWMKVRCY